MREAGVDGEGLILLADDDSVQQTITARVLGKAGYQVICASRGQEALALAASRLPELILLDVDMPDIDGFSVCKALKAEHATARIPVIFVSGMDDPLDRIKGFEAGASDYVTKPIHAGELNARVSTHIALRRQIRDLRRLKDALWQNEVRYRLLVEYTPDIFWEVDASLNLVYVSPQSTALLGIPPAQVLGKSIDTLFRSADDWLASLHLEGHDDQVAGVELRVTHADGSPRMLDISATAMRNEAGEIINLLGTARDITERKANEKRLEQLSLAVESSPVTVAISDYDGRIESVNPSFCALTGYPAEEIIGRRMQVLRSGMHPLSFFEALWDRLHKGETCIQDFCNRRRDGSLYWVRQSISPIFNRQQQITHYVWVGEDFTEAKRQEQALREAKETAERATQAKSDFLANMSHEIRTPMNAIIGLSHLCLKTPLEPRQQDYLSKISSAAESLLGIINDILDFSKIEAGHLELERTHFELTDVFGHIANLMQARVQEKGLSLAFRIAPDVPAGVLGDPTRLGQILLNLCGNAVKFTERGEIRVDCALAELGEERVELRFDVADQGIGMTAEQRQRLFTPFVQADSSTTRKYGGTGLGLTISKQIVEAMGGKIDLESTPGEGTCFFFTAQFALPGAAPQDNSAQADAPVREMRGRQLDDAELKGLQGRRILLVEDNHFNQQVAKELLALVGVEVDIAQHGREAVDMVGRGNYELVLMDLQMPEMDGLTATRCIREDLGRRELPIIAMTANAMVGDRDRCLAAGMNAHVSKPIDPNTLYATLLAYLPGAGTTPVGASGAPAAAPAAGLDLPGFDTALALGRMRGNVQHYKRMLGLFVNEFATQADKTEAAMAAGDATLARRLVHTLKGSAGTVGATALQAACATLEQHLETAGADGGGALLAVMREALGQAVDQIRRLEG